MAGVCWRHVWKRGKEELKDLEWVGTEEAGDKRLLTAWPAAGESMKGKVSRGEVRNHNQATRRLVRALCGPLSSSQHCSWRARERHSIPTPTLSWLTQKAMGEQNRREWKA